MKAYILHTIILFVGFLGFMLASYIHNKKKAKKKLICPMRSNCETVIHSDYSKILGIPVEILGMSYYAFVSIMYGMYNLFGLMYPLPCILLGISLSAFLFSLYLISIQAFVIKQWCAWCLTSAFISTIIFVLSYISYYSK